MQGPDSLDFPRERPKCPFKFFLQLPEILIQLRSKIGSGTDCLKQLVPALFSNASDVCESLETFENVVRHRRYPIIPTGRSLVFKYLAECWEGTPLSLPEGFLG